MDKRDQANVVPIGKLQWRCRRGTKELDHIFSRYLNNDYEAAPHPLQKAFVMLLEEQDPDVYDWLMGFSEPKNESLLSIIQQMRSKYCKT